MSVSSGSPQLQLDEATRQSPCPPDVYLPIEVTSREYSGNVLLAVELVSRGLNVVVGEKGPARRYMHASTSPGLLFYKGGTDGWRGPVPHTKVGMDPEAGIVCDDFADCFAERPLLAAIDRTAGQFCFGPDDHAFFSRRFPHFQNRIHLTGSPRVSLWGRSGDGWYADDVAEIRAHHGEFVLFASSGGFINETYRSGQFAVDVARFDDRAARARRFLELAVRVSRELGIDVVIRPHPGSDSWDAWQRATADSSRISVEGHLDLSAWVRAATAVVHPGHSSAAFEAVLAGTPAVSAGLEDSSNAATRISHAPAKDLKTGEDPVVELIRLAIEGELPALASGAARDVLQRKLVHPVDGASQRIAEGLMSTIDFDATSGLPTPVSRRAWWSLPVRAVRDRRPRRRLGQADAPPFKGSPMHLERVEKDVESARQVLGVTDPVHVTQSDLDLFVLRP